MFELSAKIGGRDWFIAGKRGAIVWWLERKFLLHSKSGERRVGVILEVVVWNGI